LAATVGEALAHEEILTEALTALPRAMRSGSDSSSIHHD